VLFVEAGLNFTHVRGEQSFEVEEQYFCDWNHTLRDCIELKILNGSYYLRS